MIVVPIIVTDSPREKKIRRWLSKNISAQNVTSSEFVWASGEGWAMSYCNVDSYGNWIYYVTIEDESLGAMFILKWT
jgi:hypothetical protein